MLAALIGSLLLLRCAQRGHYARAGLPSQLRCCSRILEVNDVLAPAGHASQGHEHPRLVVQRNFEIGKIEMSF